MFNKEIVSSIINAANGLIYINTNIANGHGINGVDYSCYCIGKKEWNSYSNEWEIRFGKIVDIKDNYITIDYVSSKQIRREHSTAVSRFQHNLIHLPYESIVQISEEI